MKNLAILSTIIFSLSGSVSIAQVGIGIARPAAGVSLHIKDEFEAIRLDGSAPFISWYDGNTYRGYLYMTGDNMYLYNRRPGNIFLGTNSTNRFVINDAGDVGIGTTQPERKLHIAEGILSGGSFNANTILGMEKGSGNAYVSIATNSNYENGMLFGLENSPESGGIIYNNAANRDGFLFRTNGNINRVAIDNAGDVGIGITNPGRPLDIKSRNGGDEYGIRMYRSGSSIDWEMSLFQGNFNWFYEGAQSPTAVISTNGNYTGSDRKLKQNIKRYKPVLPLVKQLQIMQYDYLADADEHKTVVGLVANDVATLFPEIVRYSPGRDGKMYYSMDYSKTGVLALKAIQELERTMQLKNSDRDLRLRISDLEKQNADLTERLAALEKKLN